MSDQQITCSDCGDVFVFSAAEQAFYAEKGLASPPKRCKACRQARKASARNGGAAGGARRPPRFSNDPNEYRSPMQMNDDRYAQAPRFGSRPERGARRPSYGNGNGNGYAHGASPGYGSRSEYRSPAFPDQRREAPRPPREVREPRAARPRPEKPRYDITCAECGAAAQVPFKPIEGRQVFCQPCYRARRGTAPEAADALEVSGSDNGIVE